VSHRGCDAASKNALHLYTVQNTAESLLNSFGSAIKLYPNKYGSLELHANPDHLEDVSLGVGPREYLSSTTSIRCLLFRVEIPNIAKRPY
jgi:hypothetical protein